MRRWNAVSAANVSPWKNLTWVSLIFGEHAGLRYLYGESAIVDLEERRTEAEVLRKLAGEYSRLADTLYGADAKNFTAEKEKLFERLNTGDRQEAEEHIYGVILAIATRFGTDGITLSEIFSQRYNYKEKVGRLEDVRSMKMWITNYINWVMVILWVRSMPGDECDHESETLPGGSL